MEFDMNKEQKYIDLHEEHLLDDQQLIENAIKENNQLNCKFHYKNGEVYIGTMKLDQKEETCSDISEEYSDDDISSIDEDNEYDLCLYEGGWKDDKKNGLGTVYFTNGDKFQGYWLDDELYGHGTYYYSDGTTKTEFFRANKDKILTMRV